MEETAKMTVFYNKRLGIVKNIVDGEQDMSFYGKEEKDYKKIYAFLVLNHNEFAHRNIDSLTVQKGNLVLVQGALEGLQ